MTIFTFQTTAEEAATALSHEIQGKTVIITGASPGGLAAEAAHAIAMQQPAVLILASRRLPTLEEAKAQIQKDVPDANIRLLEIDLGSQESVRKAAAETNLYSENIDVLINCAGIMVAPFAKTPEGIESQFGVNHIGKSPVIASNLLTCHFLLANLILPKINKGGRIINVTSRAYSMAPIRWDDINFEKEEYARWPAYAQSKSANILFSRALARKLASRGVLSYSTHPGTIYTNLARFSTQEDYDMVAGIKMEYKTIPQGAANMVVAAFDPSITDQNGGFMDEDCQIKELPEPWVNGVENEAKLWEISEGFVGQKFTY